ncbi:MAG: hypothetical protein K940chlam2_01555 [Chlamydiae bacterium]|nr:hypothetical protein [Chlamydiota bacterium]
MCARSKITSRRLKNGWKSGLKEKQAQYLVEKQKSKKSSKEKHQWDLWVDNDLGAKLIGHLSKFPGLEQIACVRKQIFKKDLVVGEEIRYYVTSACKKKLPPSKFLQVIRGHWQVENSLHHVKDRSWFEDKLCSKLPEQGWILGKLRNQLLNALRVLTCRHAWKEESMPKKTARLLSQPRRTLALLEEI